ncbi:helix-turn-helix transcriptional regulator [Candidatus Enterococcus mansonii]|uniref:HTH cro/C1-type domain-containing protein n=1 Tax=Candidatus Enterococcus mansonii TaxID=1834181 RepID=A0ABU8IJH4_9ENTE
MDIDLIAAGKRIKEIRKLHNYSMARFSKIVGNSSASTVNNWEKGNNLPNQDRLEKLAILGNTTVEWIRYGDFKDYVEHLLAGANLKKTLEKEQLNQLVTTLKKKKITYSQDLKILTVAMELFPELFETSYQSEIDEHQTSIIAEESTTYSIEKNNRYRADFLPRIEKLLKNSNNKELNAEILLLTFDLLTCVETLENFPAISQLFTLLSDILTDNISYKTKAASNVVNYNELTKKQPHGKQLSEQTIKKKYTYAKKELLCLLDQIHDEYRLY